MTEKNMKPDENQLSDKKLEQLYAQRKAQHTAPASIKKHVLIKQQEPANISFIFRRISYVATAACTLLFFGLFTLHQNRLNTPETSFNIVQLHSLEINNMPATNDRQKINTRYAQRYKEYLNQQNMFALHHKKQASLEQTVKGWQLKTCDDETMLVSNELVAALTNINQIDKKLSSGDTVNIAFAHNGIILSIQQNNKPMLCT